MAESTFSLTRSEVHEQNEFTWKIPNFRALYDVAKSNPDESAKKFVKAEFPVGGKSLGIPTKWQFYLKQSGTHIYVNLELLGTGFYTAEYEVRVNYNPYRSSSTIGREFQQAKQRFAACNSKYSNIQGTVSENGFFLGTFQDLSDCLRQDELQLLVKLTVYYPSEIHFKEDFSKDYKKALDSGTGADVNLVFTEEGSGNVIKIPAIKTILSIRNPVLAKMFGSGMEWKETTKPDVEISGVTPKAMKMLVSFIYYGEVDEEWGIIPDELFKAADMYQVDQLRKYLCENIATAITPMNVQEIRKLGVTYSLPKIVEAAMKFMKENFELIYEHYDLILKDTSK